MPKTSSLSQVRDTGTWLLRGFPLCIRACPQLHEPPDPPGPGRLELGDSPMAQSCYSSESKERGILQLETADVGEGEWERVWMDPECGLRDLAFTPSSLLEDPGHPPDPNLMKEVIKRGA